MPKQIAVDGVYFSYDYFIKEEYGKIGRRII